MTILKVLYVVSIVYFVVSFFDSVSCVIKEYYTDCPEVVEFMKWAKAVGIIKKVEPLNLENIKTFLFLTLLGAIPIVNICFGLVFQSKDFRVNVYNSLAEKLRLIIVLLPLTEELWEEYQRYCSALNIKPLKNL